MFAGDWRRYGGPQRSMLEEIHSLLEAGLEVGVMHLEALRFMRTTDDPLCAPLQELLDALPFQQLPAQPVFWQRVSRPH